MLILRKKTNNNPLTHQTTLYLKEIQIYLEIFTPLIKIMTAGHI